MKRISFTPFFYAALLLLLVNQAVAQQTFFQGFENTANDTWTLTATPPAYNVTAGSADDFWTDTTATTQISPLTGNRFWYMLDLENPSGGGSFFHTLDFPAIDVSGFSNNNLTFQYYTIGYEAADSIGYILETDNGTTWDLAKYVDLDRNTLSWTLVNVPIPAGASFVRLRLMADQNGGSDYAGFDDVQLVSANGDIVPPTVLKAVILNSTTIQLAFTEALDASAENTTNYSGVPDLSSATRNAAGDTVTLVYTTPFVNGQANQLSVQDVADLAGNLNVPFDFPFIFNNTTPKLVITEINYNPPSTDPDLLEFIEIYNNETIPVAIGGLQLGGLVSMTFPVLTLQPGETFLAAAYKTECEAFFPGQTFYPWNASTALTNGGNTLVIRNSVGVTLDSVQYDDALPWPLEPDGLGPSAELLSPNLDNNDGANWKASTTATTDPAIFASPGTVTVVSLPTIGFAATRSLVQENSGSTTIQVNINNMSVPFAEAKVRVVSASTAIGAEDYILLDTVVTFLQAAPDPFLINVTLIDDSDARNSRYLILQLTDFVAAAPGSVIEHALLINDDDTAVPQTPSNSPISVSHVGSYLVDAPAGATAEISAYDPISMRLFTTNINQNQLEIIDFKNPVALAKIASINLTLFGGDINSVAISNGVVAVALDDALITNPGKVVFFDTNGTFLSEVTVGSLPDHVNFTADGTKLLVANEGEPADDYSVDPEGSVSVIDMTPGAANLTQANVTQIGFTQFDADLATLRAAGVRIFGPTESVAQNIEPEFITASEDGKTAWVTLQEANAVAIIDLENLVATAIVPLGLKDWAGASLDASDQAPGIFFNNWNIKGMYQPDAISYWNAGGNGFLITANEGDVREWDAYEEGIRLGSSGYTLDPTAFPDAAYLKRSELLGRLNVTTATGDTDGDGDFDEIHTFGGRSISIWDANTGNLVWDSGDDLERITAADPTFGPIFNASNSNNTRKNRSDDKGPEPEGVVVGTIDGRNYAFIALERIGGLMIYDVTNPSAPTFIDWINTRTTGSYGGDQGAEGILFIPKAQSPNGRNLVVLSNETSGSISVFQIDVDKTQTGEFGLVKYTFDDMPTIGVYGDTIREGGISGLMYRDGAFRVIADRGPNADATNSPLAAGQTALLFPFPDYAPKVWTLRPENGALTVEDFDFVKRPDGTGVSGLPLPVGQGNTGEVAWSDTLATVLPNDAWGLDSEGITQDNEGNFWICDEYGVSIWKLDQNYQVINRFTPFPVETEDLPLDPILGRRRPNRGLEGVTYTPNGKILACIQSPLNNPNAATGSTSRIHRIVELDPATGTMRTFVYVQEPEAGQIRSRDWKLGDLIAINNEEFLTVEHAERNGWNSKNIYKFNIANATPVTSNDFGGLTLEQLTPAGLAANGIVPVTKELFVDLLELGWERQHDKPEGLAILNDSTFAVINDNDFGISSPNADGKIVLTNKTTRLYVYTLPADQKMDYVNPYCKVSVGNDLTICEGETATLIAGGDEFSQFDWSNGAQTEQIDVTASGSFILQATNAFGCVSKDTVMVTVLSISATTINASACAGSSFDYNGTAIAAGSTQVFTLSNLLGCDSIVTVVVEALPTSTNTLNFSTCQGTNYDFNGSSIPAGQTRVFTFTNFLGCDSVVTVNVFSLPVSATTINASACTGSTFNYNGTAIPAGQTQQFIFVNVFGCDSLVTVSVNADPVPTVNVGLDTTICVGQNITLTAAGTSGVQYQWSNGANTPSITVDTENVYTATVTNGFGCTATDDVLVEVEICIGVNDLAWAAGIKVFPNPSLGLVNLQAELPESKEVRLEVTNALAQTVRTYNLGTTATIQEQIDLQNMAAGTYFLRIFAGNEVVIRRIVLQ